MEKLVTQPHRHSHVIRKRLAVYLSCRGSTHRLGIRQGAVSQNDLVNHISTLDTAVRPKGAIPAVAIKVDAHFMDYMPAAPSAALRC